MKGTDSIRRKELGDFLKIKRASLSPIDAGLPINNRRRTTGLRREEISQLAAVSVEWYTWLEQGRDIHVSTQILERLALVLQLTPSERKHLFLLAQKQLPIDASICSESVSPSLQKFLDYQGLSPAYITNAKWDIIAWNKAACKVFGDYTNMTLLERNTIWRAFTSPYMKALLDDWESHAQKRLAQFRAGYSRHYDDPWWNTMIDNLTKLSNDFQLWWLRHDVLDVPEGTKLLHHPTVGDLVLGHLSFQVCDIPDLITTIHMPCDKTTEEKLKILLS